jgi:hypothetical protein
MLEDIKRRVRAGKTPEEAWELFRLAAFPGMDDDEAKDALLEWAEENGIEPTMFTNKVNGADVLYVMFSEK